MKTKKNRPRDLESILSEMLDLLMYKKVLKEETAQEYFDWLLREGINAIENWNQNDEDLETDISDVNIRNRITQQLDDEEIRNDYFQPHKPLSKFRMEFERIVNRHYRNNNNEEAKIEKERIWRMFNNYCAHFSSHVKTATYLQFAPEIKNRNDVHWKDKGNEQPLHQYPLHS